MAPQLRPRTEKQIAISRRAAEKPLYWAKQFHERRPPMRKHRYKCNKGLVSMKTPRPLQHISVANASNSPLLRLPAELRNTIFQHAMRAPQGVIHLWHWTDTGLRYQQRIRTKARSVFTIDYVAMGLPRVCRQIYAETATLIYAENSFAFLSTTPLLSWLEKRLLAQREVIYSLLFPLGLLIEREQQTWEEACVQLRKAGHNWEIRTAELIAAKCQNVTQMEGLGHDTQRFLEPSFLVDSDEEEP